VRFTFYPSISNSITLNPYSTQDHSNNIYQHYTQLLNSIDDHHQLNLCEFYYFFAIFDYKLSNLVPMSVMFYIRFNLGFCAT
jgi:hypothetical protein